MKNNAFCQKFYSYFVWCVLASREVCLFMGIASLSLSGWWRCPRCRCSCWSSWSWYAPTVDEQHVQNDAVGTHCKHSWSLTASRAAGGGNLGTDAISNVLKLGIANNSDMHEEKFLLSNKIFWLGEFRGADNAWPMLSPPRNSPSQNILLV